MGDSPLNSDSWKNTKAFQSLENKDNQATYYEKSGASPDVLTLVRLESKQFGSISEKILSEIFSLGPRTSTQNDATLAGRKIEIKCARFWAGSDNCRWQHLEQDHDYELVMFGLLGFHGWNIWCAWKSLLFGELREKGIVTYQGKQGWWATKSALLPYITPITCKTDLLNFIHHTNSGTNLAETSSEPE